MVVKNENDGDTPLYSISSAARMLKISVHTLRMYEKEGLILPYKKDTNHRLYSEHDINRVKCIRDAIKTKKYTIPAIKAMYSFIPCWIIKKCPEEQRDVCPAYLENEKPCWAYHHDENMCTDKNCRSCIIYHSFNECSQIKDKIKEISMKLLFLINPDTGDNPGSYLFRSKI